MWLECSAWHDKSKTVLENNHLCGDQTWSTSNTKQIIFWAKVPHVSNRCMSQWWKVHYGNDDWPLTLIQGQGVWVVLLWKRHHSLPTDGAGLTLVHSLSGDGGCSGAGPVQSVPTFVVSQTFHWTHIWNKRNIRPRSNKVTWMRVGVTSLPFYSSEYLSHMGKIIVVEQERPSKTSQSKTKEIITLELAFITFIVHLFICKCRFQLYAAVISGSKPQSCLLCINVWKYWLCL